MITADNEILWKNLFTDRWHDFQLLSRGDKHSQQMYRIISRERELLATITSRLTGNCGLHKRCGRGWDNSTGKEKEHETINNRDIMVLFSLCPTMHFKFSNWDRVQFCLVIQVF